MNNMNNNINNDMSNNMFNNMLNNNMNPMNNNIISNTSKMEIIMHLMNQNAFMQNQIEMNNQLIFKLFQENQNPNIDLFQNNNQNLQGINNFNLQNNLNNNNSNEANIIDDFPEYFGERINISFESSAGLKVIMHPPENIKIAELLSKFMKKMKLNEDLIDKKIFFLFNGYRLKKNEERNLSELDIKNYSKIIFIEMGHVKG